MHFARPASSDELRPAKIARGTPNSYFLLSVAHPPRLDKSDTMKLTFLGHAAAYLESGSEKFIFDPFLTNNPKAPVSAEEVEPTYIVITHGHGDHVGDAVSIAARTGAPIVTTFELANWLEAQGVKTFGLGLGGWGKFPFGRLRFTLAFHSASVTEEGGRPLYLGEAAGVVIETEGKTIYHAGDTALFSDMRLIAEDAPIDLALLPIGDYYTMGPKDAAKAVGFLSPKHVVPIHYGTFPPISSDPQEFARLAAGQGAEIHVLEPGGALEF
jgi:L-ascorbate metabolism protein UlaG (beta-lactamase superfamily)